MYGAFFLSTVMLLLTGVWTSRVNTSVASHDHKAAHVHGHGHGHSHSHDHGDGHDAWSGEDYMLRPGVQETAQVTHDTIVYALSSAGLSQEEIGAMNVLEVGCGPGAVTSLLLNTFTSVHALDTSPSMLTTLYTRLIAPHPQRTKLSYSLHALSPSSPELFKSGTPLRFPTPADPSRVLAPPRARFDLVVVNLVLHHVDEVEPFMRGAVGLLENGGWLVITEFAPNEMRDRLKHLGVDQGHAHGHGHGHGHVAHSSEKDDGNEAETQGKTNEHGSVNSPGHFHSSFTISALTQLLSEAGLADVHGERRGELPVFGPDQPPVGCLIAKGRKA
ncbi:hypothetical protein I317_00450 [Kwoniella heveanensis CBS 569]|uniref:Methyltransferase type 12 domain-containing protein n=1 Tax=Kwoniella heveanensis BCC8398 TaxID=1296120 RepID=A0A1B9GY56_9TREE|nr:hypothetical protein I316_02425 [Kwoniella heveanensis BCC8398]OCF45548.1 hypothetical protein I317_00450 [Kwoniella heveanensis CBS 569]